MVTKSVKVSSVVSPALLVQSACMYDCKMTLKLGEHSVNAKSLLGMMSMSFINGDVVEIIAEGQEEENAVEQMVRCLAADSDSQKAG